MKIIISILLLLLLSGCSGISVISKGPREDLYGKEFLTKINSIKDLYKQGKYAVALKQLVLIKPNPENKAVDLVGSQAWMNCSSNEEKDQLLKETVYIAKLLYKECITKPQ